MLQNTPGSPTRTAHHSSRTARAINTSSRSSDHSTGRAVARLRFAYFSHAGECAARYGVGFERVLEHLWNARKCNRRFTISDVAHMDDLVHAVACVDDLPLAWIDLAERYERGLVRKCRGSFDEVEATVFVRRVLVDLRRRSAILNHDERLPSLHTYLGTRPLRLWLADRMIGARSWADLLESCLRRTPRHQPLRLAGTRSASQVVAHSHDEDPFPLLPLPSRSAGGSWPA